MCVLFHSHDVYVDLVLPPSAASRLSAAAAVVVRVAVGGGV